MVPDLKSTLSARNRISYETSVSQFHHPKIISSGNSNSELSQLGRLSGSVGRLAMHEPELRARRPIISNEFFNSGQHFALEKHLTAELIPPIAHVMSDDELHTDLNRESTVLSPKGFLFGSPPRRSSLSRDGESRLKDAIAHRHQVLAYLLKAKQKLRPQAKKESSIFLDNLCEESNEVVHLPLQEVHTPNQPVFAPIQQKIYKPLRMRRSIYMRPPLESRQLEN